MNAATSKGRLLAMCTAQVNCFVGFVLWGLVCCAADKNPPPLACWGPLTNQLQLAVELARTNFSEGERIQAVVRIRNLGTNLWRVPQGIACGVKLVVLNSAGQSVSPTNFDSTAQIASLDGSSWLAALWPDQEVVAAEFLPANLPLQPGVEYAVIASRIVRSDSGRSNIVLRSGPSKFLIQPKQPEINTSPPQQPGSR